MASVKENLIAAKALIDTPEKWLKGEHHDRRRECFCAVGALRQTVFRYGLFRAPNVEWDQYRAAIRCLGAALPANVWFIPSFNDHPDTPHADIMALFDRAIEAQP